MSLLDRMENQKTTGKPGNPGESEDKLSDPYLLIKRKIHSDIIDSVNKKGKANVDREAMRQFINDAVNSDENNIPRVDRIRIAVEIFNDIMGYGPLEELLDNPDYSEIMVNGPNHVYVESAGKLELTGITFRDDAHVINVIDRIVSQIGRHIDESSPMVDARLPDGSRVNAVIPPISLVGPVLTIRKFGKKTDNSQKAY